MGCSTPQSAQSLLPIEDQDPGYLLRLGGSPTEELREPYDHLKQDDGLHLGQFAQRDPLTQRSEDVHLVAQRDHSVSIIGRGDGKSSQGSLGRGARRMVTGLNRESRTWQAP